MSRSEGSASHAYHVTKRHIYGGTVPYITACIHVTDHSGKACGQPTKDGAHRCPSCKQKQATAFCGSKYPSVRSVWPSA